MRRLAALLVVVVALAGALVGPGRGSVMGGSSLVSGFESGHSWVKVGSPGTWSDDTGTFTEGSQSLKCVTDGAAGACAVEWYFPGAGISLAGKFLQLSIMLSDPTNTAEIYVYAGNGYYTSYWRWQVSDTMSQFSSMANSWVDVSLGYGYATAVGTPTRTGITALKVRCKDKNGVAVSVWWDNLRSVDQENADGCLTFAFDNEWDGVVELAKPHMDDHGLVGSVYVSRTEVGTAGHMTLGELTECQSDGWEVAGHGVSDLTGLGGGLAAELEAAKAYQVDNGFRVGSADYAYHGGAYNATVLAAVDGYFESGRCGSFYAETVPVGDVYRIRVWSPGATTTPATIAALVDKARVNGEWLILVFHQIVGTGASGTTEYNEADFDSVVDDIVADGIEVCVPADVLRDASEVGNLDSTLVSATGARLVGEILEDGGEGPEVCFYWGAEDGGADEVGWDYYDYADSDEWPLDGEAINLDVRDLEDGETFYWRVRCENSGGVSWSGCEEFTTLVGSGGVAGEQGEAGPGIDWEGETVMTVMLAIGAVLFLLLSVGKGGVVYALIGFVCALGVVTLQDEWARIVAGLVMILCAVSGFRSGVMGKLF